MQKAVASPSLQWVLLGILALAGAADLLFLNLVAAPRYLEASAEPVHTAPTASPVPSPIRTVASAEVPVTVSSVSQVPGVLSVAGAAVSQAPDSPPILPSAAGSQVAEPPVTVVLAEVPDLLFPSGAATIAVAYRGGLDHLVELLSKHPNQRVLLRGHSDFRGDEVGNQRLSRDRAEFVAVYLKTRGIAGDRIDIEGVGSTRPADTGSSLEAFARNRRVEVIYR